MTRRERRRNHLTKFVQASGADIPAKAKPAGSEGLRDGQLGCWRSHADVWKRIIDENIQTAIVVEDDADWDMDIHNIFERLSQHMKKTKLGKHTRTPYELKHAPYGKSALLSPIVFDFILPHSLHTKPWHRVCCGCGRPSALS